MQTQHNLEWQVWEHRFALYVGANMKVNGQRLPQNSINRFVATSLEHINGFDDWKRILPEQAAENDITLWKEYEN